MTDDFRHRTRVEVRFRDIDAFGHVNNAVVSTYIELARIRYLVDVLQVEPIGVMPLILANISIDYLSPILFEDTVELLAFVTQGQESPGVTLGELAAADRLLDRLGQLEQTDQVRDRRTIDVQSRCEILVRALVALQVFLE